MPHSVELITTLAVALGLALLLGLVAVRLRLPALVGYLLAGVVIGPATPGFVADASLSQQLAEIGVMLLMFGVGLHLSFAELLSVRRIALPGAILQIAVATGLGAGVATLWGWSVGASLVFGLALSVASTVVLLRALESRGQIDSINGHIAIGWLVVEDIVMVLVLVLLPALATPGIGAAAAGDGAAGHDLTRPVAGAVAWTLGKIAVFVLLMLVVGRRLFPWLLWQVARTGSRELFTLCVVAAAVGIAYGAAEIFGVSFALGAFLAGMVLRESALSHRAADESLPLRDAFSVLFFVSVGMLFDPAMLARRTAAGTGRRRDHRARQNPRGVCARARVPISAQHRAHGVGRSRADRRVLVHSRGPRRCTGGASRRRTEPDPRRRADLDFAQSVRIRCDRAAAALDPIPLDARAGDGTPRRSAR